MYCMVPRGHMDRSVKINIEALNFSYNGKTVLKGINQNFSQGAITAITGPSGRGKSTFLTILNRLWENIPHAVMQGEVRMNIGGEMINIYDKKLSKPDLRRKVGMVFQTPNPLPMSIYKNMAFPLKLTGVTKKDIVAHRVRKALEEAFLWDEVHDRLSDNAFDLSGGQQQRLCIARALVLEPEVLLLDEPTSSLDSTSATVIEDLLISLKSQCTMIVVSHYLEQTARIADSVLELADCKFVER